MEGIMSEFHPQKVPTDTEVRYETILMMMRAVTKREPTLQDKNDCRRQLGLPRLTEYKPPPP